jgi:hypothetical protein
MVEVIRKGRVNLRQRQVRPTPRGDGRPPKFFQDGVGDLVRRPSEAHRLQPLPKTFARRQRLAQMGRAGEGRLGIGLQLGVSSGERRAQVVDFVDRLKLAQADDERVVAAGDLGPRVGLVDHDRFAKTPGHGRLGYGPFVGYPPVHVHHQRPAAEHHLIHVQGEDRLMQQPARRGWIVALRRQIGLHLGEFQPVGVRHERLKTGPPQAGGDQVHFLPLGLVEKGPGTVDATPFAKWVDVHLAQGTRTELGLQPSDKKGRISLVAQPAWRRATR